MDFYGYPDKKNLGHKSILAVPELFGQVPGPGSFLRSEYWLEGCAIPTF